MNQGPLPYKIVAPPEALKKAKLDNLALVPASLLTPKTKYQTITNNLPKGGILLCEAPHKPRIARILSRVASFLQEQGHFVKTLPYSMMI